jgi:hypothetical protein
MVAVAYRFSISIQSPESSLSGARLNSQVIDGFRQSGGHLTVNQAEPIDQRVGSSSRDFQGKTIQIIPP